MSGTPQISFTAPTSHDLIKEFKLQSSLKGTYNLYNSDYPDSVKKQFWKVCNCLKKCQQLCLVGGGSFSFEKQKGIDTERTV